MYIHIDIFDQFSTGLGLTAKGAQHRVPSGRRRARRGKLNNKPALPPLGSNPLSDQPELSYDDGSVAAPDPDGLAPDSSDQTPPTQMSQADPPHTNTQLDTDVSLPAQCLPAHLDCSTAV